MEYLKTGGNMVFRVLCVGGCLLVINSVRVLDVVHRLGEDAGGMGIRVQNVTQPGGDLDLTRLCSNTTTMQAEPCHVNGCGCKCSVWAIEWWRGYLSTCVVHASLKGLGASLERLHAHCRDNVGRVSQRLGTCHRFGSEGSDKLGAIDQSKACASRGELH